MDERIARTASPSLLSCSVTVVHWRRFEDGGFGGRDLVHASASTFLVLSSSSFPFPIPVISSDGWKESTPSRNEENSCSERAACSSLCPALSLLPSPPDSAVCDGWICVVWELSAYAELPLPVPALLEVPLAELERAAAVVVSLGFGAVRALRVRPLAEAATRERRDGSSGGLDGAFSESFEWAAGALPLPLSESILLSLSCWVGEACNVCKRGASRASCEGIQNL